MFGDITIEFNHCVELVDASLITILVNKHIFVVALLQKHKVPSKVNSKNGNPYFQKLVVLISNFRKLIDINLIMN